MCYVSSYACKRAKIRKDYAQSKKIEASMMSGTNAFVLRQNRDVEREKCAGARPFLSSLSNTSHI